MRYESKGSATIFSKSEPSMEKATLTPFLSGQKARPDPVFVRPKIWKQTLRRHC